MNRIEQLIAELCPDGVEYKELGEICRVIRGKRLTKNQLSDDEKYPVFHGGLESLGFYGKSNRIANTVMVINVGASAGTVGFSFVDFWSSDGCFCIEHKNLLISRYLYYTLICQENTLRSKVRAAGIPTLDAMVINKISIPIPPLPIQQEIVRILDTFTYLDAELQAELEARKKQYEHYRNQLLNFEGKEVEWKTLGHVSYYPNQRISVNEVNEDNYVGVENLLKNKQGKTFSNCVPKSGNLIEYKCNDILIGNIRPYLKKIWLATNNGGTNGDVVVIRINNESYFFSKFLYNILASDTFFDYNNQFAKGGKMPRGDRKQILKYRIPIPSISEQERIISILDKFEALVNEELPSGIATRRKQYEYYREKLLTFKLLVN